MARPSLPPHFAAVASASLLCSVLLAAGTVLLPQATQEPHVAEAMTTPAPQAEAIPPVRQAFRFRRLDHAVVVRHATLNRHDLRHGLRAFRDAAGSAENSGYHVGVYLKDLGTGISLAYGANELFYPASSIKGPYVICVYQQLVETGSADADSTGALTAPIIIESDNDAYAKLRDLCGDQVIADWAAQAGVVEVDSDAYLRLATRNYPELTPRQLACLWEQGFAYLDAGSNGAQELLDLFAQREESPIRAGGDPSWLTITKAGWYPSDDGEKYCATADAGIVLDGEHAYVVALMTDLPADLDALSALVPGLLSALDVLR